MKHWMIALLTTTVIILTIGSYATVNEIQNQKATVLLRLELAILSSERLLDIYHGKYFKEGVTEQDHNQIALLLSQIRRSVNVGPIFTIVFDGKRNTFVFSAFGPSKNGFLAGPDPKQGYMPLGYPYESADARLFPLIKNARELVIKHKDELTKDRSFSKFVVRTVKGKKYIIAAQYSVEAMEKEIRSTRNDIVHIGLVILVLRASILFLLRKRKNA